jgi:Xaa-Pro aminopeptidase
MLTADGCRSRQRRFLHALGEIGIDAALISHPRDIYYFTGLSVENKVFDFPSLLFLGCGRTSWLGTWDADGDAIVAERDTYPRAVLSTMNPDNQRRLARLAQFAGRKFAHGLGRIGFQAESGAKLTVDSFLAGVGTGTLVSIDPILERQQLRKDPDEVACIERCVSAASAGYRRAVEVIAPGVNELTVLAECHRAALLSAGKPIYFGGDFRSGERGGPARNRLIQVGEIYIVDAQADLDGYWCDLSRAYIVGDSPTDLQMSVHDHLARILRDVPAMVKPGRSCMEFWHELDARIRAHPRLADIGLLHHGGHGIGLRGHEGPDINRDRGGVFEVGNVFTVEPGAYLPELRVGIRLEDNFVMTSDGVRVLSALELTLV